MEIWKIIVGYGLFFSPTFFVLVVWLILRYGIRRSRLARRVVRLIALVILASALVLLVTRPGSRMEFAMIFGPFAFALIPAFVAALLISLLEVAVPEKPLLDASQSGDKPH